MSDASSQDRMKALEEAAAEARGLLAAMLLTRQANAKRFSEDQYDLIEEVLEKLRTAAALPLLDFQSRVAPWMQECFGPEISTDRLERNDRFIEEALELCQVGGYSKERAHALVDYVFDRSQGEINQEIGGVMVTLAAHCLAYGTNMHSAGEDELKRISTPEMVEKIRAKQKAKPNGSALPIPLGIEHTGSLIK